MKRGLGCIVAACALLGSAALAPTARADAPVSPACPSGNLLAGRAPHDTQSLTRGERITDSERVRDGTPHDSVFAAELRGMSPFVSYSFATPTAVRAFVIQADANEPYDIEYSLDGRAWFHLARAPEVSGGGLRTRAGQLEQPIVARFVRVRPHGGDRRWSIGEFALYCALPSTLPPRSQRVIAGVQPDANVFQNHGVNSLAFVLSVLSLVVFVYAHRWKERFEKLGYILIVALSLASWPRFGALHGEAGPIHYWDSLHYYLGPKYFPELGHRDLYRCVLDHEVREGREREVRARQVRNLDDNHLEPGALSVEGERPCRAEWSDARRAEFDRDVELFREHFGDRPISDIGVDHGYNGTPPLTTALHALLSSTTPTSTTLQILALIDAFAIFGAVFALGRAFGLRTAALVAAILGLSHAWSFVWTGGSIARSVWLFALAFGVASAKRGHMGRAGIALTLSGLLRLFPGVFVGALGLWALVALRRPAQRGAARRALAGILLTLAFGIGISAAALGPRSYAQFYQNTRAHTELPMGNQIGLGVLLSHAPGATASELRDDALSNPYERAVHVQAENRRMRRPIWLACALVAFGLIAWAAWRRRPAYEAIAYGGGLLFCLLPLSGYDSVWMAAIAPIAMRRRQALALLGLVSLTHLLPWAVRGIEAEHVVLSLAVMLTLGLVYRDAVAEAVPSSAGDDDAGHVASADER